MSLKHLQNAFVGVRKLIFLLNTLPLQRLHNFSLGSVLHVCIFVFAPMFRCFYCLVLFVFLWTLVWSIFGTFRSSAERYVTTRISVASFYREILFSMLQQCGKPILTQLMYLPNVLFHVQWTPIADKVLFYVTETYRLILLYIGKNVVYISIYIYMYSSTRS